MPDRIADIDDETAKADIELMMKYEEALINWTETIKETIKKVKE